MATFRGLLEVEGEPDSAVVSNVEVVGGELILQAGGSVIGRWVINDISIEPGKDFFKIEADHEVLLLRVRDPKRFASVVGVGLPEQEVARLDDLAPTVTAAAPSQPPVADSFDQPGTDAGAPAAVEEVPKRLGMDESTLIRPLALAIGGAALLLFVGALLSWGPWRVAGGRFPVERLLGALAGFAALASAYLALAGEKRRDAGIVAALSSLIAIIVIILYTAEAGIGFGFLLTIVATVAITTLTVLALSPLGAAPEPESDDPKLNL